MERWGHNKEGSFSEFKKKKKKRDPYTPGW